MRPADIARLLALSAVWGGSFIFMRMAAPVLGPVALVEMRVLLAGLALLAYSVASRRSLDARATWRHYLALGALNSAIPFLLISAATLRLPASLAAILNATTPLFGAVIAALWLREPLGGARVAGLLIGLAGVAVVTGWTPLPPGFATWLAVGASLLASFFYGLAGSYTKARVRRVEPLGMATGSQLAAALLLMPLVAVAPPRALPSTTVALAVVALALVSTAFAYVLYFRLIVDVGPTRALTVTFLVPLFGVLWGALFLGEAVTAGTVAGGIVILAGTALVTDAWRVALPVLRANRNEEAARLPAD